MQLSRFWQAVGLTFVVLWLLTLPLSFVMGMYFLSQIPSRDTQLRYDLMKSEERAALEYLRKHAEERDNRG